MKRRGNIIFGAWSDSRPVYNTPRFLVGDKEPIPEVLMKSNVSPLQAARAFYKPKLPKVLAGNPSKVALKTGKPTKSIGDQAAIQKLFKKTYGQSEVSFAPGKGSP